MINILGSTIWLDIFLASFRIPNLYRSIFAEGAMNSIFAPMFNKYDTEKSSIEFANKIFTLFFIMIGIFCLIFIIFMPFILKYIFIGFDDYKLIKTIFFAKIMFFYLFFISLTTIILSILQSRKMFGISGLIMLALNISLITALLINNNSHENTVLYLSYGVIIAGFVQLIITLIIAYKNNIKIKLTKLSFKDKAIKEFLKKLLPTIINSGVIQLNIIVDTIFASHTNMAITYLYYADRLIQLPLAIIGISLNTIIIPLISQENKIKNKNKNENKNFSIELKAINIAMLLGLPAAVGLYCLSEEIISVIFAHSTAEMIINISKILKIFALVLPSYILYKIWIGILYANHKHKIPLISSCLCITLNIILNFLFIQHSYLGIAYATVISSWLNTICLLLYIMHTGFLKLNINLLFNFIKIIIALLGMVIFIFLIKQYTATNAIIKLLISIGGSIIIYFTIIFLLKYKKKY